MNGESLLDDAVFISLIAGAIGGIGTILAALITIENLKEDRIYNKQIREEDLTREFTNKLKTLISLYITDISSYYYAHYLKVVSIILCKRLFILNYQTYFVTD